MKPGKKTKVFYSNRQSSRPSHQKKERNNSGFTWKNLNIFKKFSSKKRKPRIAKPRNNYTKEERFLAGSETKIFKPKESEITKEKIKNKTIRKILPGKKSRNGKRLTPIHNESFLQKISRLFNWFLARFKIRQRLHILFTSSLLAALVIFVLYLGFFDTKFLIKNYTITFTENSYINSKNINKILQQVRNDKLLGFLPKNQFWFFNESSFIESAQKVYPEIENVKITKKDWPNKVEIEITTEPILLTLNINEEEYWQISKNGKVLNKDEIGLRENLVFVEKKIAISSASQQDYSNNISFANYTFEDKQTQKNRFWFIIQLWKWLDKYDVNYSKTVLPSLSEYDTDVWIYTDSGTKLIFDVNYGSKENQEKRIELIFNGKIGENEKKGQISYIDFRPPKKIHYCYKNKVCAK